LSVNGQLQTVLKDNNMDDESPQNNTAQDKNHPPPGPLSTKEQQLNATINTIQHELTLKITNLSPERKSKFFQLFTQPNGMGGSKFVKLLVSMLKGSSTITFTRPLLTAVWRSVRQDDTDKNTVHLNNLKTWCNSSFNAKEEDQTNKYWGNAKTIMHQQHAKIQSQRIQQEAHDASIDHQNQMLKRKHVANRRLQQRLVARGGSLPSSFQVEPLEQIQKTTSSKTKVLPISFNATLVANVVDQHQTVEQVTAIRKKSEASRQKKAHDTNERQKSSTAQLQKRLALRQKAKQVEH
jgi:hypothetical protein